MQRPKTLDQMVTMLRAECDESTNASMGLNAVDGLYQIIRRTQNLLWDEYDWGNIPAEVEKDIVPTENFYTLPDTIDPGRIEKLYVNTTNCWIEIPHGVTPLNYNQSDPAKGQSETTPLRWQLRPDNQFELWPMPSVVGKMRFRGMPMLTQMTAGTSMGSLDADLIVLYAAAERLAKKKSPDAPIKLKLAERRLGTIRYNSNQTHVFQSFDQNRHSGRWLPDNWEVRIPR